MDAKLMITLGVLLFMIVGFLWNKFSYGVIAMTCVIVLTLTGVIDTATAFSGFSNNTTILVATMLVVAGAISKTSLAARIRAQMAIIQGKSGLLLVLLIIAFTAALTQVMGMTAVMSVMLLIIQSLDDESDLCQSRMLFVVVATICAWFGRIPIGMGAALPLTQNAYYEGLVEGHPEYLLNMFDYLKIGIIPTICLTLYTLFAWRLIPKTKINTEAVSTGAGSQKAAPQMSKFHEIIVFAVFFAVMIAFFFSGQLGNMLYAIPALGILVLIYTGALSVRDVTATLSGDMVFMVAGVLVMSSALNASGADVYIGNLVLSLLGENPSSLTVITVFCVITVIMTTFLSNNGTVAVMTPIAVSTALAGGMNPKAVVLVIFVSACMAIAFPTGCAAATIGFAVGKVNPIQMLKFTIPYLIIAIVSVIVSASIFYPVY